MYTVYSQVGTIKIVCMCVCVCVEREREKTGAHKWGKMVTTGKPG